MFGVSDGVTSSFSRAILPQYHLIIWSAVSVPSAVEKIAEFPRSATHLLRQLPTRVGESYEVREWIQQEPALLQEIADKARTNFAAGDENSSAEDIILHLDTDQLAEIALTILVRGYIKDALSDSSVSGYWRYTLACAIVCRQLSRLTSVHQAMAYSAGLLHDIGRLALIAAYPEKYGNLLLLVDRMLKAEEPVNPLEYERTLFGLDRFEIAEWLARRWDFPPALQSVVGTFENTGRTQDLELVKIVRAGSSVAHSLGYGLLSALPGRSAQSASKPAGYKPMVSELNTMHAPAKMMLELPGLIEQQLSHYSML